MISVRVPDPSGELHSKLADYQAEITGDYPQRVELAGNKWKTRGSSPQLRPVRDAYSEASGGYCMYCANSEGNVLDHFWPKAHYPDMVFSWTNFVHACGTCNTTYKRTRFAVFSTISGNRVDIVRDPKQVPVEPESGDPLLIDPGRENPLQYLRLDLLGTWEFRPRFPIGTREYERAKYTVEEVLHLNRGHLRKARQASYDAFRRALAEQAQTPSPDRDQVLREPRHLAVWHEMKRERNKLPELKRLFDAIPQACYW